MTPDIAFVLAVAVAAIVLLVREVLGVDAVALLILLALVAGGVLTTREAFASFGNEALVTVAAMFVLSASLTKTGAVDFIGRRIAAMGGKSEPRILVTLMLSAAASSAFLNNTPVAVIFLPLVLGIAEETGIPGSKLLLPMSYAVIVGGMCTVIGTSTNVLILGALPGYAASAPGQDLSLSMFTPMPLALVGLAMTVLYVATVGRRLLPVRTTVSSTVRGGKISDYLTELAVPRGSPVSGRTVEEAITSKGGNVRVLQWIRGEEILPPSRTRLLAEEDVLLVKGDVAALLAFHRSPGLDVAPDLTPTPLQARGRDTTLAELVVRPASGALGERVRSLDLHAHYGVVVLAVQRHGMHIREKVGDVRVRMGDVLLIQADAPSLGALRGSADFVVVEGVEERVRLPERAWLALAVTAVVVVLAGLEVLPISWLALAGALVVTGGGCLTVRDAYRAIDWSILVLMGGTLGLGMALDRSGAARWIAEGMVAALAPMGDRALLAGTYLLANVLTAFLSNAAAALLVLPIALATAAAQGLAPLPFVMAVMFAASIDFSTPIGYQTNTFVYGPGGYRFADYFRVGAPLNLLWWALATLLIPVFWPMR